MYTYEIEVEQVLGEGNRGLVGHVEQQLAARVMVLQQLVGPDSEAQVEEHEPN